MLSGDAHMLAIDDGTHNTYGGSGPGFPVFHAGALDRPGSLKGGPYSEGAVPDGGQFGVIEVDASSRIRAFREKPTNPSPISIRTRSTASGCSPTVALSTRVPELASRR